MSKMIVSLMLAASLAACGGGNGDAQSAAPGAYRPPAPVVVPQVVDPAVGAPKLPPSLSPRS